MANNFEGIIERQQVYTSRLKGDKPIRVVNLGDLHGYTNDTTIMVRLAEAVLKENPDFILITGDFYNGAKDWKNPESVAKLEEFLKILSSSVPVLMCLGNHDLRNTTNPVEYQERIDTFKKLEDAHGTKGVVVPLHNQVEKINGVEFMGATPRFELMEGKKGMQKQLHGMAHHEYMVDFLNSGLVFQGDGSYKISLVHDPHLIAADETGIGNKQKADAYYSGHLHGGYDTEKIINVLTAILGKKWVEKHFKNDLGYTEQVSGVTDINGKLVRLPRIEGQTNLCRGIVYLDDAAQQQVLQVISALTGKEEFSINLANKPGGDLNIQQWSRIPEDEARSLVQNSAFLQTTRGVNPGFDGNEKTTSISVIDVHPVLELDKEETPRTR